eukprot:TRINITY_DN2885_c0_g1_i12.p2 TRINITY_DN2885_c0_g1~~TRINITY_DN2885_c0_g1_i12.p2  ORF type:complete len:123 (+),score=37.87 TRINITY_DN2885_c0_g1_i12:50-418(+)
MSLAEFVVLQKLGQGSYGVVYQAKRICLSSIPISFLSFSFFLFFSHRIPCSFYHVSSSQIFASCFAHLASFAWCSLYDDDDDDDDADDDGDDGDYDDDDGDDDGDDNYDSIHRVWHINTHNP